MAMFRVKQAYYHGVRDVVVFTGVTLEGEVVAGMWLDLPRSMRGPGRVRVEAVQPVVYANGQSDLAIVIPFHVLAAAPLFEPSGVEGRVLEVSR